MTGKSTVINTLSATGNKLTISPSQENGDVSLHFGQFVNSATIHASEVNKVVDALYAAQELEVIPLRDELLDFLAWYHGNGAEDVDSSLVESYLNYLETKDAE